MRPGDVVVTSHIREYFYPDKGWAGYKAEKDEAFVFVYLGITPRNGKDQLDPTKRLQELGWELSDRPKKELEDDQEKS